MTLGEGSILQGGKYRIIRVLGQGGFGITYEAEQPLLRRMVAIKEFFMKDCCDREDGSSRVTVGTGHQSELVEKFRGKFIREAQMIAGMDHPHIVRVTDVFEENGTAYYVMENLTGGSLADKVKKEGHLSEAEAEKYIRQVADALAYIHSLNTVHLDIKPSNILLNAKGAAVLIDFGISKHYDDSGEQTSSTPVGTSKGFAPLEQSLSGDVSQFRPSTDIYSLGATLYYLLTGMAPPEATIVNEEGLERPKGVSDIIWNVIEAAMKPRRKDRPQSISEFFELLNTEDNNEETTIIKIPEQRCDKNLKKLQKIRSHNRIKEYFFLTFLKTRKGAIVSMSFILCLVALIIFLSNPFFSKPERLYRKKAEDGYTDAQLKLAACYEKGDGVKQNFVRAALWYSRAAKTGSPTALYNLGLLRFKGLGIDQNYSAAVSLFYKASEQGYSKACYYLGVCYEKGLGVEIDSSEAINWYQQALSSDFRKEAEEAIERLTIILSRNKTTNTTSGSSNTRALQKTNSSSDNSSPQEPRINTRNVGIFEGETIQLSISGYNGTVSWESDSPGIASVTRNGLVTGHSPGKTTIWARCGDVYKTCNVQVNAKGGNSQRPN